MSWVLLIGIVLTLSIALAIVSLRRLELARMARALGERAAAVADPVAKEAQLHEPVVDLSRCLGCGTCVAVCPEQVLDLVHGQAVVIDGAHCQGIAACERECPVGAITITVANLETRRDVPVVDDALEAPDAPGLFLAGEVTARALIKVAVEHGARVANTIARRVRAAGPSARQPDAERGEVFDLLVVGAGPAGLACSLEARRQGLRFATIDQGSGPGGTVAKYPRHKLVMSEPVELPLHGRLRERTYTKERLIELWSGLAARHELPIEYDTQLLGIERAADGGFVAAVRHGPDERRLRARFVCLAIGRRGTPRRLGVPGEDLPHVAYGLSDAQSFQGRRILVVGGGDSAVETALALAEQPGNHVVLSYRRDRLSRVRARNRERLQLAVADGRVAVVYRSRVVAIDAQHVMLEVETPGGDAAKPNPRQRLAADDVFVMIGGVAPFELLERVGVSFDPSARPAPAPVSERGTGVTRALAIGLGLALATLGFALWHGDYYSLPHTERPAHDKHVWLRPGQGLGIGFGIAAALLIVVNLLYLLRRHGRLGFTRGSLTAWMTSHVATGILALLFALLHGAMAPRDTVGGQAFWALFVLLVTGAIGRYFYAWVPRAANGRELELGELKARLHEYGAGDATFVESARARVLALVDEQQWRSSFVGRLIALLGVPFVLRRALREIEAEGRATGQDPQHIRAATALARDAHQKALAVAHCEDLRAVLATWRFLHRWVALLMVLLVIVHVVYALSYSGTLFEGAAR